MKPKPHINKERVYQILRVLLGIVFLAASWNKIIDPRGFAVVIGNYQILPDAFINPFALLLPWVEAFCGCLLISGYLVKGATLIVNVLMAVFITALLISLYRGVDISCGCFSNSTEVKSAIYPYLLRDLAILLAGSWVLFFKMHMDKLSSIYSIRL